MANKTAMTIIVSVILTVILISLVNVGTSIILDKPQHNNYCNQSKLTQIPTTQTNAEMKKIDNSYEICNNKYMEAMKPYNQYRYYIFAGIGFILLMVGLFAKEGMFNLTGLTSGGILVAEGIVINLQNKIIVFFSLLMILIIFGIVAKRVIRNVK